MIHKQLALFLIMYSLTLNTILNELERNYNQVHANSLVMKLKATILNFKSKVEFLFDALS